MICWLPRRLDLAVELRLFGAQVRDGDLLISTVPAGAADFYAERAGDPRARPCAVLDVVYSPWPTPRAIAATQSGIVVVSGFDLLQSRLIPHRQPRQPH